MRPLRTLIWQQGNLVDSSGQVLKLERRTTLKANVRAKEQSIKERLEAAKRKGLLANKEAAAPEPAEAAAVEENPYYDPRIAAKTAEVKCDLTEPYLTSSAASIPQF